MVAEWLLEAIGLGAYFLVFSLALLDAALLSRRQVGDPWFSRLVGAWAFGHHGLCRWASRRDAGPVIGPGDI